MARPPADPATFYFPIRLQAENLGDVLICRGVLDELRARGRVRVVAEHARPSLVGVLGLSPDEMVARAAWVRGLLGVGRGARVGRRVLVLKPGGLVNPRNRKERLRFLVRLGLVGSTRASGAAAAQVGFSGSDLRPPWRQLERAKVRMLTVARPRDQRTVDNLGLDVAPTPDAVVLADDVAPSPGAAPSRTLLVVSVRQGEGIGPDDAPAVADAVARAAAEAGLVATVVTQVGRDAALNAAVAAGVGTPVRAAWDPDRPDSRLDLYDTYSRSAAVVSNRLHVLLVAWLLGAPIVALVGDAGSKIPGALASTGAMAPTLTPDGLAAGGLAAAMAEARATAGGDAEAARAGLRAVVRSDLARLAGSTPAPAEVR